MVERCEEWIKGKLVAPSSYRQVTVTIGIPDEKRHRQTVFISYDSVNSYNAPIRGLERCDFPYGAAEAKIRPVTEFERNAVAATDADYPSLGTDDSESGCCMPASPVESTPSANQSSPKVRVHPGLADASPAEENELAVTAKEPPTPLELCWQDYCPCEQPQGGPDKGLCRQLRAGIPIDAEIMASAAMMRDARQQLEDFERDNPDF